jgi:hypothetical protein
MNRIKDIWASRFAGTFCLLFAIANRIIFASLYSMIGVDTKLQLVYAQNLLAGKGMGVTRYFTSDLNAPIFDTYQEFPPGFSFLIIPFLKLFNNNEDKAVLAYDIVVAILFVIAVRLLGKKAGLPPSINNIVTLIAGCTQYIFFMAWSTTDAICVCLIMFGLAETISIINKKEDIRLLRAIGAGLLFFSPFFFRYMYLPITLLLPFLILLSGVLSKNRDLKIRGLKTLVASASFIVLLFSYSLSTSGNALHVTGVVRGFFFDQFLDCYPFLHASFINLDFGAQLIQQFFGLDYSRVMFYLKIINPLILTVLLFLLWRYINANKKPLQFSNHFLCITIGSFVCITILLLLAGLTLTYKELSWGFYRWTFVSDSRYFAFIYAFIPVLFFVCLYHYSSSIKKPITRFFVFVGLLCMGVETVHGIYYNGKILISHKDLEYIHGWDDGIQKFPSILTELKKQYPDREILVCSKDQFYLHMATQRGYKAIYDYANFLQADLKVSSKSILLMPINTQDVVIIKDYIEKKKPRLLYEVGGISFYIQEIDP